MAVSLIVNQTLCSADDMRMLCRHTARHRVVAGWLVWLAGCGHRHWYGPSSEVRQTIDFEAVAWQTRMGWMNGGVDGRNRGTAWKWVHFCVCVCGICEWCGLM